MTLLWFAQSNDADGEPAAEDATSGSRPSDQEHAEAAPVSDEPTADRDPEEEEEASAMVADLLPWTISILFHAGLVLLASFIIWTTQAAEEEKKIIPSTQLGETPNAQLETTSTETETQSSKAQAESSESSADLQSTVDTSSSLIAANSASGSTSPFGSGAGESGGTGFMGQKVGGNVEKLVFLIDASGSLIDSLPYVIRELKTTIQELSPQQKFTVIFFRGENLFDQPVLEVPVPERGLKEASSRTKELVNEWITLSNGNIVPGGEAPPIAAIRQALRYRPELLVLLSGDIIGTGIHQIDQKKLLEEIKQINTANTKINTIQFLYPDPLASVPGMKGTMKLIAEQSGGRYKFVDEDEVAR
jgi:hypothetical protein